VQQLQQGTNLGGTVNPETGEISGGQPQTPEEVAASVNVSPASGEQQIKINEPTLPEKIRNQGTSGTVTSNYVPLMPVQTGGIVDETGAALIHKGEEVISPENAEAIKRGSIPSILQGIDSLIYRMGGKTLQPVSGEPVVNMNFYAPVVKVDKMSSEMDLYKIKSDLIAFLRKEAKSAMKGGM